MPVRSESFPGGIIRLQQLLSNLKAAPKLKLDGVKTLRIAFSPVGNHIGARHFVKNELPRIRWENPTLAIEVQKVRMMPKEWRPEMEVELEDGTTQKIPMHNKVSTLIMQQLMDVAGGEDWKKLAFANRNSGIPVLPDADKLDLLQEELNEKFAASKSDKLPTLREYLAAHPEKATEVAAKKPTKRVVKPKTQESKTRARA